MATCSQTKRLTIRQHPENIQFFLNYGQTCGQAAIFPAARSRFARVSAVFRPIARFSENRSRKRLHAPKPSALPLGNTPMDNIIPFPIRFVKRKPPRRTVSTDYSLLASTPIFAIKAAELDGFCDMSCVDGLTCVQVGNGAGYAHKTVMTACG